MPFGYVYRTYFPKHGAFYIGQHARQSVDSRYFGSGRIVTSYIRKHGTNGLIVDVLGYANSQKELDNLEIYCILAHRLFAFKLFNLLDGARGARRGTRRPTWVGRKISASKAGKRTTIHTPELCAKISASLTGKKRSLAFREKMRAIALSRPPPTQEHKQAMRLARLGRKFKPLSEDHKRKLSESNKATKAAKKNDEVDLGNLWIGRERLGNVGQG